MKKTYIGIAFVVLVFGIWVVQRIVDRVKGSDVVRGERLDNVRGGETDGELELIGKAPSYTLVDQNGKPFSSDALKGKVHVLEFFFSTCPTICPIMNQNMLKIEQKFFGNPDFAIVSITINPENDKPQVLKEHAEAIGVKSSQWHFLTGEKDDIYKLANTGFNIYAGENAKANGGFEHSGLFALIDRDGNIRCRKDDFGNPILYYDGTEPAGVEAIMQDIKILLDE